MSTRTLLQVAPRATWLTLSLAASAIAVGAGWQASAHMQAVGVICGQPSTPHCPWCAVALASVVVAAGALAWVLGSGAARR